MLSELWIDGSDAEAYAARFAGDLGEALRSFVRDGFAIIPGAVPHAAIDTYMVEFNRLKADPADAVVQSGAAISLLRDSDTQQAGSRVLDTFIFAASALDLMFSPRIEEFLQAAFDDDILAFQSLHFEVGSTQALHQDTAYVVVDTPLNLAASWIALEDVQEGSGELVYYPGSHRFPHHFFGGRKHWDPTLDGDEAHDSFLRTLTERAKSYGIERRTFRPRKGDVLIWHADLAHGGGEITRPGTSRQSFVTHYCPRHSTPHYFAFTPHATKLPVGRNAVASMYHDRMPPRADTAPQQRPVTPSAAQRSHAADTSVSSTQNASLGEKEKSKMPSLKSNAFQAWDRAAEPLEDTELRIHDGASTAEELRNRARTYVDTMGELFPYAMPPEGAVIMEIGSGVGYIMEAAMHKFKPKKIVGLDVAPSMIAKAKARLSRDTHEALPFEFLLYDGVNIPVADNSIDFVYSVASLQHVPKHFVYNLIYEISRILNTKGRCVIHLLSVNHIALHNRVADFRKELESQIQGTDTHWHHFYAFDELVFFLADAAQVREIDVVDGQVSIWFTFAKSGPVLRYEGLLRKTHLGREDEVHVAYKLGEFERRVREAEAS